MILWSRTDTEEKREVIEAATVDELTGAQKAHINRVVRSALEARLIADDGRTIMRWEPKEVVDGP